jgi:hypothetical protein
MGSRAPGRCASRGGLRLGEQHIYVLPGGHQVANAELT